MSAIEKQIREHLDGYPQREKDRIAFRESVDVFHITAHERFDKIDRELKDLKDLTSHQNPSQKTMLMFDSLSEDVSKLSSSVETFHQKFDNIFDRADKRYAKFIVEVIVFSMLGIVFINFMLSLVKSHIN